MDKLKLIEAVKAVGEFAKTVGLPDFKAAPTSDDTKRTYQRIWNREKEHGKGMEGVSAASWRVYRAALRFGYAEAYRNARKTQDRAQRAGDLEEAARQIRAAATAAKRFEAVSVAVRPEKTAPKKSKRKSVPRTADWRQTMYEAARPEEQPIMAVLWAAGCRPCEIAKGVEIRADDDGNPVIGVLGGKVSKVTGAGQAWRLLTIDRNSKVGKHLAELVTDGPYGVKLERRKLEKMIERIARHAGHPAVTAYTFRHATGADEKRGGDREKTAKVLGHASGLSQQGYGTASQSKGGSCVLAVEAARPVVKAGSKAIQGKALERSSVKTAPSAGKGKALRVKALEAEQGSPEI